MLRKLCVSSSLLLAFAVSTLAQDSRHFWKHPEKRDYFFGSHDVNRVQFSMGRDLHLNPPQNGKPLNYFVYPYVEVDGQEYPNVSLAFSFGDVASTVALK